MPRFRITIRHGRGTQYAVEDVEATTLADALRHAAEVVRTAALPDADLAEIRVHQDPEARSYSDG